MIETVILVAGTAIPLQLTIYAVWKLAAFRPVRDIIARMFYRLPLRVGFSLLVLLCVSAIFTVVMIVRDFIVPADSWALVTAGFLLGVMGPVLNSTKRQKRQREQAVDGNPH